MTVLLNRARTLRFVESIIFVVVLYLMAAFALFWLIRLAVRYGMDDALERNRHWLEGRD
jgi:uncharacterized membrane protein YqjE